jgi:hypothetical protein
MSLFWPGVVVTLASAAVIIALVTAGWRKTALIALVPAGALLWTGWIPQSGTNIMTGLSVYLLVAVALIAGLGPGDTSGGKRTDRVDLAGGRPIRPVQRPATIAERSSRTCQRG